MIFGRWGTSFRKSEEGSGVGSKCGADKPIFMPDLIHPINQGSIILINLYICCKCTNMCLCIGIRQHVQFLSESSFAGLEPKMFSLSVI